MKNIIFLQSNFTEGVDNAFMIIFAICLVFLVGITFTMVYFAVKYNKKRHPQAEDVKDNTKLEIAWTVIPTILVLIMFFVGWKEYQPTRKVPSGAISIKATGFMWKWKFDYENGKSKLDTLVVPINKPVKLDLYSPDVLHSLYIPAFRIKEDVVPGKNNYMWFTAEELGEYDILCAEYCGVSHAYMLGKVKVVTEEEYTDWVNYMVEIPDTGSDAGLAIIESKGCVACHTFDGTSVIGPSFKGLYGSERKIDRNGEKTTVVADDAYIIKSILEPGSEIVDGYQNLMQPIYKDLSDEELQAIIDYLKTLNEE